MGRSRAVLRQEGEKPKKPKKKYIGKSKPEVEFHIIDSNEHWEGKLYPEWMLEIEDGDHTRLDEQGYE